MIFLSITAGQLNGYEEIGCANPNNNG